MTNSEKKPNRWKGRLVLVAIAAAVVAAAIFFGKADEESKTPCQIYAKTVTKALDNCHSGRNRSHRHHIDICEKLVAPTQSCFDAIRAQSCDELDRTARAFGGAACEKPHE